MAQLPLIDPPEPLTPDEKKIELVKGSPPKPASLYLIVAVLTSIGGLIMGWIYLAKDGAANKRFGILALILGLVLPALIATYFITTQTQERFDSAPLPAQPGVQFPE